MSERSGIEIDYCPECRGVWLDRGGLDKMINQAEPAVQMASDSRRQDEDDYRHTAYDSRDGNYRKKKKKESFLADLFEF